MSTNKSAGSTSLGRDSAAKRLGVKIFSGSRAKIGNIIVRQRGTKYLPGKNVKIGSDDTIYAIKEGVVNIKTKSKKGFDGSAKIVKVIDVI